MIVSLPDGESIDLEIERVSDLLPHEHTIPALLDSMIRDLERSGYQRDPIIIDKKTKIVLDGMHRRAALEAAGAKFALCACFDYEDQRISVHRWLRYFIAPDGQMLSEILALLALEKVKDYHVAVEKVDNGESPIALLSREQSFCSREKYDLVTLYKRLGEFDQLAETKKIEVEFRPDVEKKSLFLSESVYVLYPLPFDKKDILEAASNRSVFPYKTTRHTVPIRPMGVYFPLTLLKGNDYEPCKQELSRIIENSKIRLVEANSWYEGRRYPEPIVMFERETDFPRENEK